MDWTKVHVGQHRQGPMTADEIKAAEDAGQVPGINPDLHSPEIALPGDTVETNLHGDVAGSPYSSTPGEISLAEAGEQDKAANANQPASDAAGTREIEMESRRTGVSTETLAAAEEADNTPSPKKPAKK